MVTIAHRKKRELTLTDEAKAEYQKFAKELTEDERDNYPYDSVRSGLNSKALTKVLRSVMFITPHNRFKVIVFYNLRMIDIFHRLSGIFQTMDIAYELAEEEISQGAVYEEELIKERMLENLAISKDSVLHAIKTVSYSDQLYIVLLQHHYGTKGPELQLKSRGVFYSNLEDPIGEMPEEKVVNFAIHVYRIYHQTDKYSGNMVINMLECLFSNLIHEISGPG